MPPLLSVDKLRLSLAGPEWHRVTPVDGASFELESRECVGLVGESGCGKSLLSMTLLGLTRGLPGASTEGRALLRGKDGTQSDLLSLRESELEKVRGGQIAMVFQDPLSCLNPLMPLGQQVAEAVRQHEPLQAADLRNRVAELLAQCGIAQPLMRLKQYPHELSGGLRQRAMLAIALAGRPSLLIADEPTTALDVTIQAQILETMQRLQEQQDLAILFITHDLGVVAQLCSRVMVMYAGRIVEQASSAQFFTQPLHPYSQGLLGSLPARQLAAAEGASGLKRLYSIPGSPPRPGHFPPGCRFAPRCPLADARCRSEYPPFSAYGDRFAACWKAGPEAQRANSLSAAHSSADPAPA